ncbi:hypothetical protein C8A00DRAFT_16282 [Chaetomidium leptoderma]|uniref:Uncharacterized protein n=1 Tax=Chaetomidium leptoderma TaxID=669021 RepID=A0AAN6VIX3_9PEZI|nr:hypothetical protein C8A00DRAFT_16282 [Chaetomidium leptoderma]
MSLIPFRHIGQYSCGTNNGQPAIFICNNGRRLLTAICARRCEQINNLPYCV